MTRGLEDLLHDYQVGQVSLAGGITVPEETPLEVTLRRMRDEKFGCVVTMRDGKATGIFTERDFIQRVLCENVDWQAPIRNFVTRDPVIMKSNDLLRKALYLMRKKNFRHIPIFGPQGELSGVLSIRNIMRLLAEHFPADVMNHPPRLGTVATSPEGG